MSTISRATLLTSILLSLTVIAGCGGGGGHGSALNSTGTSSPGTSIPGTTPPRLVSAMLDDVDGDHRVGLGDRLVLTFDREVVIGVGAQAPDASDLLLPVTGNDLGQAALFEAGSVPEQVVVVLGSGATMNPNGTFDAGRVSPGSPSGIDVASTIRPGAIRDNAGMDAQPSTAVDISGVLVPPPPPPPASAPSLTGADYLDTNGNGLVDQGDEVILGFDEDVQMATGANAPSAGDIDLPVAGDTFGMGALLTAAGVAPNELLVLLGSAPSLQPNGSFLATNTTLGSASGVVVNVNIGPGRIFGAVTGLDVQTGQAPVDLDGSLAPGLGPIVISAVFADVDQSGFIDSDDTITVTFSSPVVLGTGNLAPVGPDFDLPVQGDQLSLLVQVEAHVSNPDQVVIRFTQPGTILEPNGSFDPANLAPGSPSGLGLSASLPAGVITDLQGNDARSAPAVDIDGSIQHPTPPLVQTVVFVDADLDGLPSPGDRLVVQFDQEISFNNAAPGDFTLAVASDGLGVGARVIPGARPDEVSILLGDQPVLTVPGDFNPGNVSAGSASGIDVSLSITSGSITNRHGLDAVAQAQPRDVAAPGASAQEDFSNQLNQDPTVTSASWNLASSGLLEAALNSFDVGTGTDALIIDSDSTIDTEIGHIGGVPAASFRGSGIFELASIEVRQGVTVAVTGRHPLTLKASGDVTIAGTISLDAQPGQDQPSLSSPGVAGGQGGPGGFAGGSGGDGGTEIAEDGQGPCPGRGGASQDFPGAGGGGGFSAAGEAGEAASSSYGSNGLGGDAGGILIFDGLQLHGGSGGGGGGGDDDPVLGQVDAGDEGGAGGGGGGGALRVVSGGRLEVSGTIRVLGGAGGEGLAAIGGAGGGGGSGGAILLQAIDDVVVTASASLLAHGGPGGGGYTNGGQGGLGYIRVETARGLVQRLSPAVTGRVFPMASESIIGSLDTGAGSDPFHVTTDAVLNTDTGMLDGQVHPGFRGQGEFEVSRLELDVGTQLRVEGSQPLSFKVAGSVSISGTIDLDGASGQPASGLAGGLGGRGRAGGSSGGNGGSLILAGSPAAVSNSIPADVGQGSGGGSAATNGVDNGGGGGGSFGSLGTSGLSPSSLGGQAGSAYGVPDMNILEGGSGGGGGNADEDLDMGGGGGGAAGGGAIRIHAAGEVVIAGRISSQGGSGGTSNRGGTGGAGSGGAIVIRSLSRIAIPGELSAAGGDGGPDGGHGGHGRIRLEDLSGSFVVGQVTPTLLTDHFATSVGASTWLPVVDASGQPIMDPVFVGLGLAAQLPAGTNMVVELDGAEADPQDPTRPDPASSVGFTDDPIQLDGKEFIRFRVSFRADPDTGAQPSVDAIAVLAR